MAPLTWTKVPLPPKRGIAYFVTDRRFNWKENRNTMRKTIGLAVIVLLALGVASAWAQNGRLVITPFAGYRTSGSFGVRADVLLPISGVRLADGFAYGASLGFRLKPSITLEAQWAHADPMARSISDIPGGPDEDLFKVYEDQFHANVLFYFGHNEMLRPFFITGLGLTAFNPRADGVGSETRFSWSMGLGVEKMFNDKVGLRASAKWFTTYINESTGWMVDWWGDIWLIPVSQYMPRWDFTAGLLYRF